MKIKNLGFMASSRGTNMQAIIDACNDGRLTAQPVVVISNNVSSGALERAKSEGIPAFHISSNTIAEGVDLDQAITDCLLRHDVDLVVLAGYMKKIGAKIISAFHKRIINIHPALLPKYGGLGMYGNHIHEAVLAAGDAETGVTIHVVDEGYDTGSILAQRKIPVRIDDNAESLAKRVLSVEHEIYVETIGKIVMGKISLMQS